MYLQHACRQLKYVSEEEYLVLCNDLAPVFAGVPRPLLRNWPADSSTGTLGGICFWKNRVAMDAFTKTELFSSVATHPDLANLTSTDYGVMEEPTGVTRGLFGSN